MNFKMNTIIAIIIAIFSAVCVLCASSRTARNTAPLASPDVVSVEADGVIALESEHFYKQTLTEKRAWHITSPWHTPEVHTGVPMQLWLEVEKPGAHELMVAMREDGCELDKLVLAPSAEFKPDGTGPAVKVQSGTAPAAFTATVEKTELMSPRQPDGDGTAKVSGELKQWHKVTLTLDGPFAGERDVEPNPFTDLAFNVTFTHESGAPIYKVPGYFAADGNAAESGVEGGTKWRAHLSPDKAGTWKYTVAFARGNNAALDGAGEAVKPFDGVSGSFQVDASDKTGRDFRAHGRLQYVGSGEFFLKAGSDAPETMLAYADFDNTIAAKPDKGPLKTWAPHVGDWRAGDPTWRGGNGKGLIARFSHVLALNWNIGEENTQSTDEVRDMVRFLHDTDPYRHPVVLHTFPPEQELVYRPLLGDKSLLTGLSLQNPWKAAHQRSLQWRRESAAAGRPWVVAQDEQNPASLGVPPDPGYRGHSGVAEEKAPPKGKEGEGFTASSG